MELCLEGCQKFCPQGVGVCIQGGVCIGGLPVGGRGSVCGSAGGSALRSRPPGCKPCIRGVGQTLQILWATVNQRAVRILLECFLINILSKTSSYHFLFCKRT